MPRRERGGRGWRVGQAFNQVNLEINRLVRARNDWGVDEWSENLRHIDPAVIDVAKRLRDLSLTERKSEANKWVRQGIVDKEELPLQSIILARVSGQSLDALLEAADIKMQSKHKRRLKD